MIRFELGNLRSDISTQAGGEIFAVNDSGRGHGDLLFIVENVC
jgi:hypothetical protein